jgi:hypothetical protein
MHRNRLRLLGIASVLALGLTGSIAAPRQLRPRAPSADEFTRSWIPAALEPYVIAVGRRIWRPGEERVVLDGQFADSSGVSAARVTMQLPGLVRLDGVRDDGSAILFDGADARAGGFALNQADQLVLDAFAVDSIEAAVGRVSHGAAFDLLGRDLTFGLEGARAAAGGPWDVAEITGPLDTEPGHPVETRRYYFNTHTRLLESVRHLAGGVWVETRFSGWAQLDGSLYPGKIERYRDGVLQFSFTTQSAGSGPSDETSIFRVP